MTALRRFIVKLSLFSGIVCLSSIALFLMEDGYSDEFYLRLTTEKQKSLVLGNSRAAQDLIPSVLNKTLDARYEPMFNYSFTLANSPYGPTYLESVKMKLLGDSTGKTGCYILCVDPWSVSVISDDPDDSNTFPERSLFLGNIKDVNSRPNFWYLLDFYPHSFYEILWRRFHPDNFRLHSDGWLQINIPMDAKNVKRREDEKFRQYTLNSKRYKFSKTRFDYLEKTIEYLHQYGDVYLVRLPVHEKMLALENYFLPDFTSRIDSLASKHHLPYFDMSTTGGQYIFTDGNHLYKGSSAQVSKLVADWVNERKRPFLDDDNSAVTISIK